MAMQESWVNEQSDASRQGVTVRSLVLGLGLALLTIVWNTYVEYIAHTGRINITHFPISIFAPYAVLALGNGILRRYQVSWALSAPELLAMLAMGLVGAAIPAYGLTSYFLGLIAIPYYLATPENQWVSFFHQYLPTWLIPSNEGGAMQYLFEGLPSRDMPIPWAVWVGPLMGWMMFIGAIALGSICVSVILRKQWSEYERLAYPILQPAVDLAETEARVSLFKNHLFWIGVAIPFFIFSFNMISYFSPGFPRISLSRGWMPIGSYFPHIHVSLNLYTMGFAYFANIEVLLSIWVFYLFYCTQVSMYRRLGINLSGRGDTKSDATAGLQAGGAFVMLVLWGLWMARHHIRDVFRKAFNPSCSVDDSDEMLSYRFSAFGFIFSLIFMIGWLQAVGIAWMVSIVLTLGFFMSYIGVARVIAETGVVYYSMSMSGLGILPFLFGGPNGFDPSTKTALTVVNALAAQGKGIFMPPLVHVAKIGEMIQSHRKRLALGVVLTIVVGIAVAIIYTLYLGYTIGAYNFNDYPFTRYPPGAYDGLVKALKSEVTWETERYYFLLLGALTFALVSFLRYRFAWWPLSPIGMVVPLTHAIHSIFTIFLAWGVKMIIMQIGGVSFYRRTRPLFLGLLVGYVMGVLVSFLVDQVWFPGQGHGTHSW
ncbi:MAG: hypothetical protein HN521_09685 [Candidatus Latescibacteria bacterium]|jgi:hypothetical protein|nr:hypothetical protein [Candidatus Latescibacterota bacterium]